MAPGQAHGLSGEQSAAPVLAPPRAAEWQRHLAARPHRRLPGPLAAVLSVAIAAKLHGARAAERGSLGWRLRLEAPWGCLAGDEGI